MADPTPIDTPTMSAVPSGVASAAVSAVGTPQSIPPMDPEERTKSINVSLADLTAKATALYLAKNYEEAAEVFSQATEMQAELNGEMAPENADILFLYGRSLFKVGQSKSDVLGGKAPSEKKKPGRADKPKAKKPQEATEAEKVAQEGVAAAVESAAKEAEKPSGDKKGLFQFTGDENWEDSEGEEEEEEAEGEEQEGEEEDEDDLAVAFEILDLSRVLFHKRIEELEAAEVTGEEKIEEREKIVRHIKERLAETHDLLAEISLENEKFPEAIKDCRSSLEYKLQLYPGDSELIAEAHFKLSLALEFASVTTTNEDDNDAAPKPVDEDMRKEAAAQLEKAIASTQLKLDNKEVELAMMHAPEDNDTTRKQITEVKELIADMEQRLVELRKPPMDVNQALGDGNPLTGILGAALGETAAQTEARVEAAKKSANDLSGLVRKKAKDEPKPQPEATNGNGKRKAEDDVEEEEMAKKVRVESATEPADVPAPASEPAAEPAATSEAVTGAVES